MNTPPYEDLRLVERVHVLRTIGLGLGSITVAAALIEVGANPLSWLFLLLHGWVWPQLAWQSARRSTQPRAAERRNLVIDSALGGVWIALMHFMLLPSVVLFTMLSMDKLSVGGWRFLARTGTAMLLGMLLTGLATGFAQSPQGSLLTVYACLPLLVVYPLAISTASYALVRKVRTQNERLEQLSRTDALTGLLNRSHWEELLAREMERFRRGGPTATLLMIDTDRFKDINDLYGHPAGDSVLRKIGKILGESVRGIDAAGRYGGDEFGILLTGTKLADAMIVADRIRRRVAEAEFDIGLSAGCTISIGAAELGREMEVTRDWILQADVALYRAKQTGRNQTATLAAA